MLTALYGVCMVATAFLGGLWSDRAGKPKAGRFGVLAGPAGHQPGLRNTGPRNPSRLEQSAPKRPPAMFVSHFWR